MSAANVRRSVASATVEAAGSGRGRWGAARRGWAGVAAVLWALTLLSIGAVGTSGSHAAAAPPTDDAETAADLGARWLTGQVTGAGYVAGPTNQPSIGATLETALALAAAEVENPTFALMVDWLESNVESVIAPDGGPDNPGNIGYLLMILAVSGHDPTNFGGQNLPARLNGTLGAFAPGLYGANDPTYDGVFRQALALLGLRAVGITPPNAAVDWLETQQCTAPSSAAGGWEPFRADPGAPCNPPDPMTFTGPDTNSSAMAVVALQANGGFAGLGAAMAFLDAAQDPGGGFGFIPGLDPDPNSTALVVMAARAAGEDPDGGRWLAGASESALDDLLSWQIGCDADPADRGAFASPFSSGLPDAFATRQAVWAADGVLPADPAEWEVAPVPCEPPSPSTSPSSTMPNAGGPDGGASGTSPVIATPAFAG